MSIMETLKQTEKVPGCQPDWFTSQLSFAREISCPVADEIASESEVYRDPI